MADQVVQALEDVVSNNGAVVRLAGEKLESLVMSDEHQLFVVQTLCSLAVSEAADNAIRLAAAIFLKNFICNGWTQKTLRPETVHLMRTQIVEILIGTNLQLRAILMDIFKLLASVDFPENMSLFLPNIIENYLKPYAATGVNEATVKVVIEILAEALSKYDGCSRNNQVLGELKYILEQVDALLLKVFLRSAQTYLTMAAASGAGGTENSAALNVDTDVNCSILQRAIDCIRYLHTVDLPEFYEDNVQNLFDPIFAILSSQARFASPNAIGNSDKVKTSCCALVREYTANFSEEFMSRVCQSTQAVLDCLRQCSTAVEDDALVCMGLRCLVAVSNILWSPEHDPFVRSADFLKVICGEVIVRNIVLREEEIESAGHEPLQYLREDLEGATMGVRRELLVSLIKAQLTRRDSAATPHLISTVNDLFTPAGGRPSVDILLRNEAANFLMVLVCTVSATRAKGIFNINLKVPYTDYLKKQVSWLLVDETLDDAAVHIGVLKGSILKLICQFRRYIAPEDFTVIVDIIVKLLSTSNILVYSYAAATLERLLGYKEPGVPFLLPATEPILAQALDPLLGTIRSNTQTLDNEYVMRCLWRLLAVVPQSPQIHAERIQEFLAILKKVATQAVNPLFCHYLFETVATLTRTIAVSTGSSENTFAVHQYVLEAMVSIISDGENHPYVPYCYQVLSGVISTLPDGEPIDKMKWQELYRGLFTGVLVRDRWEASSSNIPGILTVLIAFVRKFWVLENLISVALPQMMELFVFSLQQSRNMAFRSCDFLKYLTVYCPIPHLKPLIPLIIQRLFQFHVNQQERLFHKDVLLTAVMIISTLILKADFFCNNNQIGWGNHETARDPELDVPNLIEQYYGSFETFILKFFPPLAADVELMTFPDRIVAVAAVASFCTYPKFLANAQTRSTLLKLGHMFSEDERGRIWSRAELTEARNELDAKRELLRTVAFDDDRDLSSTFNQLNSTALVTDTNALNLTLMQDDYIEKIKAIIDSQQSYIVHSTTEDDLATLRGIYGTEEFGDERRWRNSSRNIAENFFEFLRPKYAPDSTKNEAAVTKSQEVVDRIRSMENALNVPVWARGKDDFDLEKSSIENPDGDLYVFVAPEAKKTNQFHVEDETSAVFKVGDLKSPIPENMLSRLNHIAPCQSETRKTRKLRVADSGGSSAKTNISIPAEEHRFFPFIDIELDKITPASDFWLLFTEKGFNLGAPDTTKQKRICHQIEFDDSENEFTGLGYRSLELKDASLSLPQSPEPVISPRSRTFIKKAHLNHSAFVEWVRTRIVPLWRFEISVLTEYQDHVRKILNYLYIKGELPSNVTEVLQWSSTEGEDLKVNPKDIIPDFTDDDIRQILRQEFTETCRNRQRQIQNDLSTCPPYRIVSGAQYLPQQIVISKERLPIDVAQEMSFVLSGEVIKQGWVQQGKFKAPYGYCWGVLLETSFWLFEASALDVTGVSVSRKRIVFPREGRPRQPLNNMNVLMVINFDHRGHEIAAPRLVPTATNFWHYRSKTKLDQYRIPGFLTEPLGVARKVQSDICEKSIDLVGNNFFNPKVKESVVVVCKAPSVCESWHFSLSLVWAIQKHKMVLPQILQTLCDCECLELNFSNSKILDSDRVKKFVDDLPSSKNFEVIDLTRTGIDWEDLLNLASITRKFPIWKLSRNVFPSSEDPMVDETLMEFSKLSMVTNLFLDSCSIGDSDDLGAWLANILYDSPIIKLVDLSDNFLGPKFTSGFFRACAAAKQREIKSSDVTVILRSNAFRNPEAKILIRTIRAILPCVTKLVINDCPNISISFLTKLVSNNIGLFAGSSVEDQDDAINAVVKNNPLRQSIDSFGHRRNIGVASIADLHFPTGLANSFLSTIMANKTATRVEFIRCTGDLYLNYRDPTRKLTALSLRGSTWLSTETKQSAEQSSRKHLIDSRLQSLLDLVKVLHIKWLDIGHTDFVESECSAEHVGRFIALLISETELQYLDLSGCELDSETISTTSAVLSDRQRQLEWNTTTGGKTSTSLWVNSKGKTFIDRPLLGPNPALWALRYLLIDFNPPLPKAILGSIVSVLRVKCPGLRAISLIGSIESAKNKFVRVEGKKDDSFLRMEAELLRLRNTLKNVVISDEDVRTEKPRIIEEWLSVANVNQKERRETRKRIRVNRIEKFLQSLNPKEQADALKGFMLMITARVRRKLTRPGRQNLPGGVFPPVYIPDIGGNVNEEIKNFLDTDDIVLDISNCCYDSLAMEELIEKIHDSRKSLQAVVAVNCAITSEHIVDLAHMLSYKPLSLKELDLSVNRIAMRNALQCEAMNTIIFTTKPKVLILDANWLLDSEYVPMMLAKLIVSGGPKIISLRLNGLTESFGTLFSGHLEKIRSGADPENFQKIEPGENPWHLKNRPILSKAYKFHLNTRPKLNSDRLTSNLEILDLRSNLIPYQNLANIAKQLIELCPKLKAFRVCQPGRSLRWAKVVPKIPEVIIEDEPTFGIVPMTFGQRLSNFVVPDITSPKSAPLSRQQLKLEYYGYHKPVPPKSEPVSLRKVMLSGFNSPEWISATQPEATINKISEQARRYSSSESSDFNGSSATKFRPTAIIEDPPLAKSPRKKPLPRRELSQIRPNAGDRAAVVKEHETHRSPLAPPIVINLPPATPRLGPPSGPPPRKAGRSTGAIPKVRPPSMPSVFAQGSPVRSPRTSPRFGATDSPDSIA